MQDFNNKVAVITGGASGVGRSLAFALARRGAKVVVADVDRAGLESTEQALKGEGAQALGVYCDVTRADSVQALAAAARDAFGGIHLVFANAGIGAGEGGAMWEYSEKDWQWAFNVNVWGVINSINAFMPILMSQGEPAHFVVTGSGNGAFVIYPDAPIYTATKAAVHAITENLYYQVKAADSPVKVHALFPGPYIVDTGLFNSDRVRPEELKKEGATRDSGISSVEDMRRMMAEFGMELRTTHPDEVADMALAGLEKDKFWLLELTEETEQKMRDRLAMILERRDPEAASVG